MVVFCSDCLKFICGSHPRVKKAQFVRGLSVDFNAWFTFQTSYKKPGPPTPSKKAGRLSLQVSVVVV